MNSDLLTNIDFEDMYNTLIDSQGDFIVATIPYNVNVPYAVIETTDNKITNFVEKPTYTYYSNAGIYIFKKEFINDIPSNEVYNATDLMDALVKQGKNVLTYPILGYWLDIGNPEDYAKAQRDVTHIKF